MLLLFLLLIFLLKSQGTNVSAQVGGKTSCTNQKGNDVPSGSLWREGCLVHTCKDGNVEESLAEECVELIGQQVKAILKEEYGITRSSSHKEVLPKAPYYKTPGIIVAGGSWQKKVKMFKPETKEVCNLPDIPEYFSHSSINLLDGTPILCGSWFGSPGNSRMKNETKNREFFAVDSCVQLSPASKEAEWTIYAENLPLRRDHVSMVTPEGILLMGGYSKKSVTLVKPDGSAIREVFSLKRYIDRGCGIVDEDTLIITGGGSSGRDAISTKTVDRYNSQGHVEDLPDMIAERRGHGCGYFHKDGKKVLVVAGGYQGRRSMLSSTEMFTLGSKAWISASPLPKGLKNVASTSLNDKIYIIVGDENTRYATVYEFDGKQWTETQEAYYRSGMNVNSEGNRAVAVDLETSGFNQLCN